MKHILSLILLTTAAMAQAEEPDSTSYRQLDEVTVVANAQFTTATKTVYIPTADQKAASPDGTSLLMRMAIPQLSVNPVAETIKTADSQEVSLFINYHQATAEDISGLNTADVIRVEYLDFPTDPRFLRAQHAVNFITRTHDSGGYTKLSASERFMVNSGEASIYSKLAYGKMVYDVIAGGDYDRSKHTGSTSDETYRFGTMTIGRLSGIEAAEFRNHGFHTTFRATYNRSDNLTFRNLISYRRVKTTENSAAGFVRFTDIYPSENYSMQSPAASNVTAWDSELYATFGKGWSAEATFHAELPHNRTESLYHTETSVIENNADEKSWWLNGSAQINKMLSDRLTLFSSITSLGGRNKITYSGSSEAINRFRQSFAGVTLGASLNFKRLSGSVDGGYAFESNYINGKTMRDSYPFTHISLQYAPDSRHSVSLWFQFASLSPDATMKNPNIIRQSELMYVSGNPDLKCSRLITAHLGYTWLHDNRWQLTAYATLFRINNRQTAVYTPDGPDGMMLKKYQNDGDYNHGQIGTRLTAKLPGGKLALTFSPTLLLYRTTGSNSISHYPFTASFSADYYAGNFFVNAFWESRSSYVDGETAYLRRIPPTYSLSAGWTWRGLNIQLAAVNIFRSSWDISRDILKTGSFYSEVTQYGSDCHRRLTLTVTYTLNYGKKVSRNGELSGEGSIATSILH